MMTVGVKKKKTLKMTMIIIGIWTLVVQYARTWDVIFMALIVDHVEI